MAHELTKKQAVIRMIGFGIASAAVYAGAFYDPNAFVELCSRGGGYTALPIATVLLVSFVHGGFASNLWTALGITAKVPAKTAQAVKTQTKRPEARATLNA